MPQTTPTTDSIAVEGCLSKINSGDFELYNDTENYRLTGNTSALSKFDDRAAIRVRGIEDAFMRSLHVLSVESVNVPKPILSSSFKNPANWRTENNQQYGIKFGYPRSFTAVEDSPELMQNFAGGDGVALARLDMGGDIYPEANFGEGVYGVSVDPAITNRESCGQFGESDPRYVSSRVIGGTKFRVATDLSVAMGRYDNFRYFHTFQNGLCYELVFDTVEWNTGNIDSGCFIPSVTDQDVQDVVDRLVKKVSFFHPEMAIAPAPQKRNPKVTSFFASSDTADDAINRGEVEFSWTTQDADYVEFSFTCSDAEATTILSPENCNNGSGHSATYVNRPPNSTADLSFGDNSIDHSVLVTVTITSFSNAVAYPDSSKSLSIRVTPYDPFPGGLIPTAPKNMTVSYGSRAETGSDYAQGSNLQIAWTDTAKDDSCVNLYLVQEDGPGNTKFRAQMNKQCLTPPKSTFTWTVSERFLGAGFRIFASGVGNGNSGTLGPSFNIVRKDSDSPR